MFRFAPVLAAVAILNGSTSAAPYEEAVTPRPFVAGVWVLNRELSPAPAADDEGLPRRPESIDPSRLRKIRVARERLTDVVDRFSIALDGARVIIVDAIGRATRLVADGKKQDRVTGDGEFETTTRFDGEQLVVTDNFSGTRIITTYEPHDLAGARRLRVTVTVEGLTRFRFGKPAGREQLEPRVSIYDRDPSIPARSR